jgi:hypothetical protein
MNEHGMAKNSWERMKEIQDGFSGHHTKPTASKMKMENGD